MAATPNDRSRAVAAARRRLTLIAVGAVIAGIVLAIATEPWIGALVGLVCLSYPALAWFLIEQSNRAEES